MKPETLTRFPWRASEASPLTNSKSLVLTTLLFFDDNALGVRDNVIRGVGRPELVPESVWYDEGRLNTAWGYPGVFFDENAGLWRMAYQASVADRVAAKRWGLSWCKLLAESDDGFQWRPTDTRKIAKVPNRRFPHQAADGTHEWCGIYVDECKLFGGDSTSWRPTWTSGRKLSALKGRAIQVAIELNNARLYALRGDFQTLCPQELITFGDTGEEPDPRPGF